MRIKNLLGKAARLQEERERAELEKLAGEWLKRVMDEGDRKRRPACQPSPASRNLEVPRIPKPTKPAAPSKP